MSLNNLSPIAWHKNTRHLHHTRTHSRGELYCLPVPVGELLPFQLFRQKGQAGALTSFKIVRRRDGVEVDVLAAVQSTGLSIEMQADSDLLRYVSTGLLSGSWESGHHYAEMADGVNTWTSDYFLWTNDLDGLIKIEYSHSVNIDIYKWGELNMAFPFKFRVYLKTDLSQPVWRFERQVDTANTIQKPYRSSRYKDYRFLAVINEALGDAMSLIPICHTVQVTHLDSVIDIDQFTMPEPQWDRGLAFMQFSFRAGTLITALAQPGNDVLNDVNSEACLPVDFTVERYLLDTTNQYATVNDIYAANVNDPSFILYGQDLASDVALYYIFNQTVSPATPNEGAVVFVQTDNSYYLYHSGEYIRPRVEAIGTSPNYTLTAKVLPRADQIIQYRTAGGAFTPLPGTYTTAQLAAGVDLGAAAANYEEVRVVSRTATCGDIYTTLPVYVTAPPVTGLTGLDYEKLGAIVLG